MTTVTSSTSEGAQDYFSKITFLKSVHSNSKDEVCLSVFKNVLVSILHTFQSIPPSLSLTRFQPAVQYDKKISVLVYVTCYYNIRVSMLVSVSFESKSKGLCQFENQILKVCVSCVTH